MDFFSKCDQIRRNLQIWSHLLKKSLMENFIFCAVLYTVENTIRQIVQCHSSFCSMNKCAKREVAKLDSSISALI